MWGDYISKTSLQSILGMELKIAGGEDKLLQGILKRVEDYPKEISWGLLCEESSRKEWEVLKSIYKLTTEPLDKPSFK